MIHLQPLYSLAGVLVGLLVGMTGVGGGSLMTPLLVLAFGFHPATAVGTDLLYASGTKVVGTGVHGSKGTVDWTITRRLATGSLPATLLTLWAIHAADARTEAVNTTITVVLGAALVLTGIATFFRGRIVARLTQRFQGLSVRRVAWLTIALGVMLGVLVTLTSVGAGALGMTALLVLYPRAPLARLVGSDIAHAVPLTLLAGIGHASMGTVDASLLVSLLAGSIPGIVIGSLVAAKVSERVLVPVLAVTLVVVGARLLV